MFTIQITKFEKTLFDLGQQITQLKAYVTDLDTKLGSVLKFLLEVRQERLKSWKQFEACAKGFRQTRDACECLRQELSDAAGTMIENSWND